jgi:aspartyl/asparaginyl-tRNA synthetase
MGNRLFNVRSILAGEAPKDVAITVKGWVRTRRDSKAGISFIHLSDGSTCTSIFIRSATSRHGRSPTALSGIEAPL